MSGRASASWRREYKYRLDAAQEALLRMRAAGVMTLDRHCTAQGGYRIRSVYFDDDRDSCLTDSLAGTDPRSKLRIRRYNDDTDYILLEKKSKLRGLGKKENCLLTRAECEALLRGDIPGIAEDMPPEKATLFTELALRGLRPRVIVTYDRTPFVYSGGNVRVTFDTNLTSSPDIDRFLTEDYPERPVLPPGQSILEVKWDELLPRHLKDALCPERLTWTAFSKYVACRRLHL